MKSGVLLQQNLLAILDIARLAPSVHNTQAWVVKHHDNSLIVSVDPAHQLGDGDPTGRQTIISLGIFCESIILAAASVGLKAGTINLQDRGTVIISFVAAPIQPDALKACENLRNRASDRSIYRHVDINPLLVESLEDCSVAQKTTVRVSTNTAIIEQVASLTGKAINVALSSPGFRLELSQYLVVPGSRKLRGIAVGSLYINPLIARLQPFMLRHGINMGAEVKLERQRWQSASAVLVITAPGDVPKYWLEVGRTYLQVSLAIEKAGLSQATSAAIVEASNYHDDIEASFRTHERILAVIRIGAGSNKRKYSPRISAEAILTSI